ncbi:unnamed protein product [Dracunculus medinensis]|uniref:Uncharacterized protein n=1 Tax=Dracunculus medinensis TaxID=318479 RepID=A0A0N4UPG5_DRAME|nr:unnamed protein product [Dracunculus medinensis]
MNGNYDLSVPFTNNTNKRDRSTKLKSFWFVAPRASVPPAGDGNDDVGRACVVLPVGVSLGADDVSASSALVIISFPV